jgi:ABC-2 type transport system permease protein
MMSTNATTREANPTDASVRGATPAGMVRLTFGRVVRSEWIKFRSLRSNWILVGAIFAAISVFGLLAAAMTSSSGGGQEGPGGGSTGPVDTVLVGANLALLLVGVLGALLGSREYSSGMIRLTLAAVPGRLNVLWAKAIVFVAVLLPVVLVALTIAFFGGMQALSAAGMPTNSLTDDGVLRVLIGAAGYLVAIGIGGLALGVLLRSIAGSIGILIGGVLFAPALASALLPDSWDTVLQYLPSNAGASFTTLVPPPGMLSPGAGALVLAAWVVAGLVGAAVSLRRRDA